MRATVVEKTETHVVLERKGKKIFLPLNPPHPLAQQLAKVPIGEKVNL